MISQKITSDPRPSRRVLVVEDNRTVLLALSHLLEALGHTALPARGVAEALEIAASQPFDLVLSDLGLGDGSGIELFDRLLPLGGWPAIAMSGHEDLAEQSLAVGFLAFLAKPVSLLKLDQTIREVSLMASTG